MKKALGSLTVVVFVFALGSLPVTRSLPVSSALAAAAPSLQPGAPPASSKVACLDCHGPFDKLVSNANYQAPSGEKVSPHRYVPHSAKEMKAIPECSNCHVAHPVPPSPTASAALPKPDVQWCYSACHHKSTFQLCKDCHK